MFWSGLCPWEFAVEIVRQPVVMVILRVGLEAQVANFFLEMDTYARHVTRRGAIRCTVVGDRAGRESRIAV